EKQKGSRGIRRGQWYRLVFQFPIREHRQIKYRNNVIECDHGKLKRIIGATLGFKSMKTAYATIKGIEVMRALRKGQASAFYYGDPLGEMRLVSRVFEM
uniref:transposase n=1 Tax=Escherichia coli TaxID=562 RepID=UPI001F1E1877